MSGQAAQGGAAADPSMEDILASIRRILSEDEGGATVPDPAAPASHTPVAHVSAATGTTPAAPVHDSGEVLALDASMMVAEPAAPPPSSPPEPVAHGVAAPHHVPPLAAEPVSAEPEPARPPRRSGAESLVAPEAMSAAASAMGPLLRKIASDRSQAVYRGGPTLEDIVREEMRPLLKQWLDANLPATVERLVRAEIERVVNSAVT